MFASLCGPFCSPAGWAGRPEHAVPRLLTSPGIVSKNQVSVIRLKLWIGFVGPVAKWPDETIVQSARAVSSVRGEVWLPRAVREHKGESFSLGAKSVLYQTKNRKVEPCDVGGINWSSLEQESPESVDCSSWPREMKTSLISLSNRKYKAEKVLLQSSEEFSWRSDKLPNFTSNLTLMNLGCQQQQALLAAGKIPFPRNVVTDASRRAWNDKWVLGSRTGKREQLFKSPEMSRRILHCTVCRGVLCCITCNEFSYP